MKASKSTVDEIRQRFDAEIDRYSNLETGQVATVDAPLAMKLVAEAAAVTTPHAKNVLDVGCGAGNYTLKLLERMPNVNVTLLDLSQVMLDRDEMFERIIKEDTPRSVPFQLDLLRAVGFSEVEILHKNSCYAAFGAVKA